MIPEFPQETINAELLEHGCWILLGARLLTAHHVRIKVDYNNDTLEVACKRRAKPFALKNNETKMSFNESCLTTHRAFIRMTAGRPETSISAKL